MTEPLWITEANVAELIDMVDAIEALEKGLRAEASGDAINMMKAHLLWDSHSSLHAIGAAFPREGVVGTKTWAHTPTGAAPLLVLYDARDGRLTAVIEAFVLGQLRTGGISGVATKCLAAPDACEMAMIGVGKQAITQLAAITAIRPLRRVRLWGPTTAKVLAFADMASGKLELDIVPTSSVEAAVDGAPIVTLATRAKDPFLFANTITRGTHVNAIGAIAPERAEFEPALLDRCAVIAVDSVAQVRRLSWEFIHCFGSDEARWARVEPIAALIARGQRRPDGADVTMFKAMGMGISDLALGIEIYHRATARGVGRVIPRPENVEPRLSVLRRRL